MGYDERRMSLVGRPAIGQVPLLIFAYLGLSLFISGFAMTVLAFAPTDSYLMVMIQQMGVMEFVGPIILIMGSIMVLVTIFYCCYGNSQRDDDDDDDYDDD